jgi:hypothetical protein
VSLGWDFKINAPNGAELAWHEYERKKIPNYGAVWWRGITVHLVME